MPATASALVWSRQAIVADAVALAVDALVDVEVRVYRDPRDADPPPVALITCGMPPDEVPGAAVAIALPDDGVGAAVLRADGLEMTVEVTRPDDVAELLARFVEPEECR